MFSVEESLEMRTIIVDIIDGPHFTVNNNLTVQSEGPVVNVENRWGRELDLVVNRLGMEYWCDLMTTLSHFT